MTQQENQFQMHNIAQEVYQDIDEQQLESIQGAVGAINIKTGQTVTPAVRYPTGETYISTSPPSIVKPIDLNTGHPVTPVVRPSFPLTSEGGRIFPPKK